MTVASRVLQTVILAAGSGSRLATTRGDTPKPLITVCGRPLMAHALAHAASAGCEEALVVVGHEAARVRSALECMDLPLRLRFVENADYTAPNGVSLLAAERLAAPAFFLQMVDHLFGAPALGRLVEQPMADGEVGRVLVDSSPSSHIDLDDATKVCLFGDRVTAIGKGLAAWNAIDAGCFLLTGGVFDALRRVPPSEALTVSSGMRRLVAHLSLGVVDLCGAPWADVDTPLDRDHAEQMFGQTQLAQQQR
jgi:choline kinase